MHPPADRSVETLASALARATPHALRPLSPRASQLPSVQCLLKGTTTVGSGSSDPAARRLHRPSRSRAAPPPSRARARRKSLLAYRAPLLYLLSNAPAGSPAR